MSAKVSSGRLWVSAASEILKGLSEFDKTHPGILAPNAYAMVLETLRIKEEKQ